MKKENRGHRILYVENEVRSIVVCALFLLLQYTHRGYIIMDDKRKQVYEYKAMIQKRQRYKIMIFHKVKEREEY